MIKWNSFQITNIVLLSVITALIVWVVLFKPMFAGNYYGQMTTKQARELAELRRTMQQGERLLRDIRTNTVSTQAQREAAMQAGLDVADNLHAVYNDANIIAQDNEIVAPLPEFHPTEGPAVYATYH